MKKPKYSLKRENLRDRMRQELEENKKLIKKPREVLFLGAANTGKSSLINRILKQKICRVSKKPGNTKYFNVYPINIEQGNLVDSPGYF